MCVHEYIYIYVVNNVYFSAVNEQCGYIFLLYSHLSVLHTLFKWRDKTKFHQEKQAVKAQTNDGQSQYYLSF